MKILILTSDPNGKSVKKLVAEAKKNDHQTETLHPGDLMGLISPTDRGHDKIYQKSDNQSDVKRVLAKDYDVIIPRFAGSHIFEYGVTILQHLSGNMGIPSTADPLGLRVCSNKFLTHQALSQSRVRTIKTMFCNRPEDFGFIVDQLGVPLVCKTLVGSQGSGVFILNDLLSISTALSAVNGMGVNLLLQKFINTGKPASDLRIYVVDGEAVAGYRRISLDDDFRSNYSISKKGEKIELTPELKSLAVNAAKAVGLPGCCGVDIIEDSDSGNKLYVVECNGNASLVGIEEVTKINIAAKIIQFAEKIAKKRKPEPDKKAVDQEATFIFQNSIFAKKG